MLWNIATGDLRPRQTEALPEGFEPVPFDQMGLKRDAVRRAVPPRQWSLSPPVAVAGRNQVRFDEDDDGFETVELDASASYDPDGRDLRSWLWSRKGREIGRGDRTVAELPLGEHRITVRVMNYDGYWDTDEIRVTVLGGDRREELTAGASAGNPAASIAVPEATALLWEQR